MIRSGFFNSKNHDKQYYASDISRLFNSMITEGVFGNVGEKFIAKPGNGMKVIIPSGMAWFNSTWTMNDSDEIINLDEAPYVANYKRIDGIFLKIYPVSDTNVRDNTIYYMKGAETIGVPEKPVPTITDNEIYVPLCYITVNYGTTAITASMIKNCVGLNSCPFITGILKTVDASELIAQWESQFNEWIEGNNSEYHSWLENKKYEFENWFAKVKYVLDGDVAGHLQNEFDYIRKKTVTNLLKPTLYSLNNRTLYGVDIINNGDGTFTVNGTTTDYNGSTDGYININLTPFGVPMECGEGYARLKLCGTPKSVAGKARIQLADTNGENIVWHNDTGNGFEFNTVDNKVTIYALRLGLLPNTTYNNVIFKPMLTDDLHATYNDYVQYSGLGKLNENVADIRKNLTSYNGISFKFGIDDNGDYGYYKLGETSVTPFRNRHTETYKPTARANNLDMGLYHKKRYVDTTGVPNTNNDTYTITSNGTHDMGETNNNRYIKSNVKAALIGTFSSPTSVNVSNYGASSSSQFLCVPQTKSLDSSGGNGHTGSFGMGWIRANCSYNQPSVSLNGSTLTINPASLYVHAEAPSGNCTDSVYIPTSVYIIS
jgi:hypothetical protein